jgi:hypothetical protein
MGTLQFSSRPPVMDTTLTDESNQRAGMNPIALRSLATASSMARGSGAMRAVRTIFISEGKSLAKMICASSSSG